MSEKREDGATAAVAKRPKGEIATVESKDYLLLHATKDQLAVAEAHAKKKRLSIFNLERAKLPSGTSKGEWTVAGPEGDYYTPKLPGMILDVREWRTWYRETFEESGGGTPPDCSSEDAITGHGDRDGDGNLGPHDCLTCPKAQWGSARKGSGQDCAERRAIFLLRDDNIFPMLVVLPPTSIGPVDKFTQALAGKLADPAHYEVSLGMEQDKNAEGIKFHKLMVKITRKLDAAGIERVKAWQSVIFAEPTVRAADMPEDVTAKMPE